MMPAPAVKSKRSRPWLKPTLIALAIVLGGSATAGVTLWAISGPTALEQASQKCDAGEIGDGGSTLFVDTIGTARASGRDTTSDLSCLLGELQAPAFVVRAMERTRALDGRQTETWGDFSASWTYHPDEGLDVLIREK
jgi:hypothetical protein